MSMVNFLNGGMKFTTMSIQPKILQTPNRKHWASASLIIITSQWPPQRFWKGEKHSGQRPGAIGAQDLLGEILGTGKGQFCQSLSPGKSRRTQSSNRKASFIGQETGTSQTTSFLQESSGRRPAREKERNIKKSNTHLLHMQEPTSSPHDLHQKGYRKSIVQCPPLHNSTPQRTIIHITQTPLRSRPDWPPGKRQVYVDRWICASPPAHIQL